MQSLWDQSTAIIFVPILSSQKHKHQPDTRLLHVISFDPASLTELRTGYIQANHACTTENTHRRQRISIPETMAQQEVQLTDLNPGQLQEVKRQLDEVRLTKAPQVAKELKWPRT
jgi:ribosome recycling factor